MADTASGPEGPESDAAPTSGAGPGDKMSPGDGADAEDEARRKFREALERKRAKQADANAARGGKDAGKVHGAHGPARNRRSFRRKTGG
jgi:Family of unknown function (DUF5302)